MTRSATLLVLLASTVFASCSAPRARHGIIAFAAPASSAKAPRAKAAILITLDGVRWQDIFEAPPEADMPTLRRWMTTEGVAIGAPGHGEIWSTGPHYISQPGYTEILTGRTSACQSNECKQSSVPTLIDEVGASGRDAVVISSWERIAQVATWNLGGVALSSGRHTVGRAGGIDEAVLREGASDGPWPGVDDYRADAFTARVALRFLDTHLPMFTFVGLGDPDEHAHHDDRPRYYESLRAADRFLAAVEERITRDTVVFVTADHGRSENFRDHGGGSSGRVWLVAHGAGITTRGALSTVDHRLADIAPTIRCLLDMPRDLSPEAGATIRELCSE